MPPLHALVALPTPADRNVEAPHPRAAQDLFLVLRFHPLQRQWPAAVRTLCGSGDVDLFVYAIGNRPLVVGAMGRSGLAPRGFRLALRLAAGERSGLAPGSTLRGVQLLTQPLILFLKPLVLFLQLLIPPAGLVAFLLRTTQLLRQLSDAAKRVEGLEKQTIL